MKCAGKIAMCLAGGLVLSTSLRADDVLLPGNPYAPVVVRNIFGLNPPPLVDPTATTAEPPVKITLNGITDILGQMEALFKVAGKPPGQDAYILCEGQRQDDIEVVKIDEKAGVVTFNNHGIVQVLPLVAATTGSTPASASKGGSSAASRTVPNRTGGNNGANGFNNSFGNRGGSFSGRNRGGNSGADNGSDLRNVPTRTFNAASQIPEGMTPEVQTIAIEANRLQAQKLGDTESASILPNTELTPQDSGNGGN